MSTTLNLPKGFVCIEGVTEIWNSKNGATNNVIPNSNATYNSESWKLTPLGVKNKLILELDVLDCPTNVETIIQSDDNSTVCLTGKVKVEKGVEADNLVLVVFKANGTSTNTFYAAVCYGYTGTSGLPKNEISFTFEIKDSGAKLGSKFNVCLVKDDPKTSRGTVTTVAHSSDCYTSIASKEAEILS